MTSRNIGRLSNTAIQRYIGRYDIDGNNNFPMTEPHPRLIQTDPTAPDVAPLAQCSDCKCKR
ncbi:hypothetical protein DM01DRAFT_1337340, partial [Hesseltinella vesiculosa]